MSDTRIIICAWCGTKNRVQSHWDLIKTRCGNLACRGFFEYKKPLPGWGVTDEMRTSKYQVRKSRPYRKSENSKQITGKDEIPNHLSHESMRYMATKIHEAMEEREMPQEELDWPGFEFPSTDVFETRNKIRHKANYPGWREVGLLRASGYTVGANKVPFRERKKILNFIFLKDDLSDIDDKVYAEEWGDLMTSDRLKKLTSTIAALTRNAKRHPYNMSQAIEDWENDLSYLKEYFYERWGDFPWPDVNVPD